MLCNGKQVHYNEILTKKTIAKQRKIRNLNQKPLFEMIFEHCLFFLVPKVFIFKEKCNKNFSKWHYELSD